MYIWIRTIAFGIETDPHFLLLAKCSFQSNSVAPSDFLPCPWCLFLLDRNMDPQFKCEGSWPRVIIGLFSYFFLYGLALIFTYHWKSANFSDVHFLQEFQCKPTKQTRRNYGKIPWHGTNSVWSIRKSNICRRFDEMLLDIPKSGFLSRFEILVCNPGLKRNNELINLAIGMTGSMQQFWFTVLENGWKGLVLWIFCTFRSKVHTNTILKCNMNLTVGSHN